MSKIFFILSVLFVVGVVACSSEKKAALYIPKISDGTGSEGSQTDVDAVAGVSPGSVLYLKLGMLWESDTATTYPTVGNCHFPPASLVSSPVRTCSVTLPELQLFYSKLEFKVGTLDRVKCPYISFTPYYYHRSDQFITNTWSSPPDEVRCDTEPFSASCWGGAGPVMITDFANNRGFYRTTALGNESSFLLKSSNEVRLYGTSITNLMVTNNMVNKTIGQRSAAPAPTPHPSPVPVPAPTPEVLPASANIFEQVPTTDPNNPTWQDYSIKCLDLWGATTYEIKLEISDENTENNVGGMDDDFTDWNR